MRGPEVDRAGPVPKRKISNWRLQKACNQIQVPSCIATARASAVRQDAGIAPAGTTQVSIRERTPRNIKQSTDFPPSPFPLKSRHEWMGVSENAVCYRSFNGDPKWR